MVHHSDEVGRPKVDNVELDYIAFIPYQPQALFIQSMDDMRQFLRRVTFGYQVTLNPGWQRAFGIEVSPGGNFVV